MGTVLPEQVLGDVRLVAVGDAAPVAEVVQLVLPDVAGQPRLVVALLETDVTHVVSLAQVHHQTERGRQLVAKAEAAAEAQVGVQLVDAGT